VNVVPNSYRTGPDERGFFGLFGGRFVAETLMPHPRSGAAYAREGRSCLPGRVRSISNAHYTGRPARFISPSG
jgi:tryptophan synthase beta chain